MSSSRPIRALITQGDPAGIGPEVLLKTLVVLQGNRLGSGVRGHAHPTSRAGFQITVIGDLAWLKRLSRHLHLRLDWDRWDFIDLNNVPSDLALGRPQARAGRAAFEYLVEAVRQIQQGKVGALVTGPVSKEAIVRAGIPFTGHTEFLGKAFGSHPVMMFAVEGFRVSLVTTHVGIRKLPLQLTREKILHTLRVTHTALSRDFAIRKPRIGLAALNPHAGEGGLFGMEEKRILLPAVESFQKSHGLSRDCVRGPLPVDTLMREAAQGGYDAVVALYHDQALIPVKLLWWEKAVNVTLGLSFVRTSPVHGTAFDLAGRGQADSRSMVAAVSLAMELAH